MLRDFKKEKDMPEEVIEKYRNLVPEKIVEFWENYGLGSFLGGYLKIINPDEYTKILKRSYEFANISIPILATAFADIITYEENEYFNIIEYKYGTYNDLMITDKENFFDELYNEELISAYFNLQMYGEAIKTYGELEYSQCFCFVPILGAGGAEKVENLDKGDLCTHIEVITQLMGPIGDFEGEEAEDSPEYEVQEVEEETEEKIKEEVKEEQEEDKSNSKKSFISKLKSLFKL